MSRARHRQGHPAHWGTGFPSPDAQTAPAWNGVPPGHGEVSQTASKIPVRKRADRGLPAHRDETGPT